MVNATSLPTYTVTYSGNGGGIAPVDANAYLPGSMAVVLGNTFANGSYTFTGWKDAQGKLYQPGSVFEIGNADVALSAQWALAGTGHTVRYDANTPGGATAFGSVPSDAARYPAGATVTVMGNLNNLFAYDWNLAGWNTKADGTGSFYPFGGRFTMASDNVTLYGVWNESNTWRLVGSAGISAARADNPHIAIDSAGAPYVVFADTNKPSSPASVLKWNGLEWEPVGGAVSEKQAFYPHIRIHETKDEDTDETTVSVYVTFRDEHRGQKAVVRKYSSEVEEWIDVNTGVISESQAWYTSLAFASNDIPFTAFAAFVESQSASSVKLMVKKYNGTSWETVGGGPAAISGSYLHVAAGKDNTPFIVYADPKVRVRKLNGTVWEELGAAGVSEENGIFTDIAFDSEGDPYVVYADGAKGNKATVKKWSGSEWKTLGEAGFSPGAASGTHIAIYSRGSTHIPYVVYRDQGNGNRATVMKHTGTKWMPVGNPGFSAGGVSDPHIAIDGNGYLYVVYSDDANGSRVTVVKYQ